MATKFRHFAINADDVHRAKTFYEQALGFEFNPWGPPNFYQIKNVGDGVMGALQERREIAPGKTASTFETTLGVDDLQATIEAIEANGGKIVMPSFHIQGVGEVEVIDRGLLQ